jgi:DNA-binding CsgD family transcriptional regulator
MIIPDHDLLAQLTAKYLEPSAALTPAERKEVLHIAQGFACKDSATADDRALETIRSRRKRLYGKLRVSGSGDLLSRLLALSLEMLVRGERLGAPSPEAPNTERSTGSSG